MLWVINIQNYSILVNHGDIVEAPLFVSEIKDIKKTKKDSSIAASDAFID